MVVACTSALFYFAVYNFATKKSIGQRSNLTPIEVRGQGFDLLSICAINMRMREYVMLLRMLKYVMCEYVIR